MTAAITVAAVTATEMAVAAVTATAITVTETIVAATTTEVTPTQQ